MGHERLVLVVFNSGRAVAATLLKVAKPAAS